MISDIISDIGAMIASIIGTMIFYGIFMWIAGVWLLANLIGPLFIMWGIPLPDWTILRITMLFIPVVLMLWVFFAGPLLADRKYGVEIHIPITILLLVINLYPVVMFFGHGHIRAAFYNHMTTEQITEFWHWRASDPWIKDPRGQAGNMQIINRNLIEIGAEPMGSSPKWATPREHMMREGATYEVHQSR